jgi:hypothetical protein
MKSQLESLDFKENEKDNRINAKSKNGKPIFLILYVDDILLTSSDVGLQYSKYSPQVSIRIISVKCLSF